MHITLLIILTYIVCCLRVGAAPWKFFQLNARYFSKDQGIFSKLAIDQLIPTRWRLAQVRDDGQVVPNHYPVFVKPEWGQNAHGIQRADSFEALQTIRASLKDTENDQQYILQDGASGSREFEIFSIDVSKTDGKHDVITVTEAANTSEAHPINSKYNSNTHYVDISDQFSEDQLAVLSNYLDEVGSFAISRMSVRTDSIDTLLAGQFHVIEVNLFLPMPINLLDESDSMRTKFRFIRSSMMSLALATKALAPVKQSPAIFTRMMMYGRRKKPNLRRTHKLATRRTTL